MSDSDSGIAANTTNLEAVITPSTLTARVGESVTLDGSQSTPTGQTLEYNWWQQIGTKVLSGIEHNNKITFTVPSNQQNGVEVAQRLTFVLQVYEQGQQFPSTATATVNIPVVQGGGAVDHFGIQKIYADKQGTYNNWEMTNGANDPRFYEQKPVDLGNGWFTYPKLQQGRIEVLSKAGLRDTDIDTYHMGTLIGRGYTHLPNNHPSGEGDWGGPGVGIECTVRYRNVSLGSGGFEAHPEWVWGTFRQSTGTSKAGQDGKVILSCQAGSYHANIYYQTNRAHFEKDMQHTKGYTAHDPEVHGVIGINGQQEHVHKAIWWVPTGTQEVHMEQYLSTDGGKTFKLLQSYVDNGGWTPLKSPGAGTQCGYTSDGQPISNAKCAPGIRVDFMNKFEFKDMSIRTIDYTQKIAATT